MRVAAGVDGNHCHFNDGPDKIELSDDDDDNSDDDDSGQRDDVREHARAQFDARNANAGDRQPAESPIVHLPEDHGSVCAQEKYPTEFARSRDRRKESPRQGMSVQESIDEDELGRAKAIVGKSGAAFLRRRQ